MSLPETTPPEPLERMSVLTEREDLVWEGGGLTNPGVVRLEDGTIGMVYRGCGSDGNGYLGFCRFDPEGREVIAGSRSERPLITPTASDLAEFPEGYGDPRINKVQEWYYIWANGRNNAALEKSRLKYDNDFGGQYIGGRQTVAFRTKDFESIESLGLYGPNEFDKNAFLHPEQVVIDGVSRIAMFHRVQYSIQVAIAERIEDFHERRFWREHMSRIDAFTFARPIFEWEGVSAAEGWPGSIAGGAPPIEIDSSLLDGVDQANKRHWLLFYNGCGAPRKGTIARDRKIGALVYTTKTDPNANEQPFSIVMRTPQPLLVPKEDYEKDAANGDIVFVTGALPTPDGTAVDLFYGSGDHRISKSRFDLQGLVRYLCQFDGAGQRRTIQ
jgi:predicted GH43/DUF377 family glycosyl hydrolase